MFWKSNKEKGSFALLIGRFQDILDLNNQILELTASTGDMLGGNYVFDQQYIRSTCQQLAELVRDLIRNLDALAPRKYATLYTTFDRINNEIKEELSGHRVSSKMDLILPFDAITRDSSDAVGLGNANLAEISKSLNVQIPDGFAITTRASVFFWEYNILQKKLDSVIARWENNEITVNTAAEEIQEIIRTGVVPAKIKKAVRKAVEKIYRRQKSKTLLFAIRNSEWGEDAEHSFAGQHVSLLNEPGETIVKHYKTVLASIYSTTAMEYRRQKGISQNEILMSVTCQVMTDVKVSGVIHTLDPVSPQRDVLTISAAWGLGTAQSDGRIRADRFEVDRNPPHAVTAINIVRKKEQVVPRKSGGIEFEPVGADQQTLSCLSQEQIKRLTETGLAIERYFMKTRDIEFAFDQEDHLMILQNKPLHIKPHEQPSTYNINEIIKNYPVIFSGRGEIAQKGICTGPVFFINTDSDLESFPQGAVLVARYSSPQFSRVIKKASGIITDIGSATGPMASIAREFRVPAIVGTETATSCLTQGQEITLDASENCVYGGIVKELCHFELMADDFEETYEYRLLRRILKKIDPLHLLDSHDKDFTPAACRTFHDITRFVHEKAIEEIIEMNFYHPHFSKKNARKLDLKIPLDLILIDLGDGFSNLTGDRLIQPENIASIPLQAFLSGLTAPGVWSSNAVSVDFGSFMSSVTRTSATSITPPKNSDQNLAVVSREYANINLRLGYHFNMVDACMSEQINDNYLHFRFLGGVSTAVRRSRRVRFLAQILEKEDFIVNLKQDLVVGRIKNLPLAVMKKKMHLIGLLVAFTRQLDVSLISEDHIAKSIVEFNRFRKDEQLSPIDREPQP
ncbi:MAG: PEP/pyruvate-binding domain-containing protein [bacterium]